MVYRSLLGTSPLTPDPDSGTTSLRHTCDTLKVALHGKDCAWGSNRVAVPSLPRTRLRCGKTAQPLTTAGTRLLVGVFTLGVRVQAAVRQRYLQHGHVVRSGSQPFPLGTAESAVGLRWLSSHPRFPPPMSSLALRMARCEARAQ